MTYRPTVTPRPNSEYQKVSFANWLAQLVGLILPRNMSLILGRGSAKTTEFLVTRLIEMAYDMPGAPICWVSDTYSNLQKNVLPMVLEGLERKGYYEGVHYVIEKTPPSYTEEEKSQLPDWLREHFWKPYNKVASYKHTIMFFTGLNVTFGSLDRPSSLAGKSYVHVIGDEVKYFPEAKIANLLKAVRGYRVKYGNSPFYRGTTFTTDMPNKANVGEYDWILKQGKQMNVERITLLVKTALIVNECRNEWMIAKERGDDKLVKSKLAILRRWEGRLYALRTHPDCQTFFFIASSYVNVDILTPEWFRDAFAADLGDVRTAILSMKASLENGDRFYANLSEVNFYRDGSDTEAEAKFGLKDEEDCRILKYLQPDKALDMSMDFGNQMSMTIAQQYGNDYRVLKSIYTLSPEWIREMADKFLRYFTPHQRKYVEFYYDRAGNNYSKAGEDLASKLKSAIEIDAAGKKTGWRVTLMSVGEANIPQTEEYYFMQEFLTGKIVGVPRVLIDFYNCKHLRLSLESARTRIDDKSGKVLKDKRSEKLPIHRLPFESTNFSDSFKYLVMRKKWREAAKSPHKIYVGNLTSH